jgi:signal transduction histidine kinase
VAADAKPWESPWEELAQFLETERPAILLDYEQALVRAGNPVIKTDESRRQTRAQAGATLSDLIQSLRRRRVTVDSERWLLTRDIGEARAAGKLDPRDSLRAAGTLFEIILARVERHVSDRSGPLELLALTALAVNGSINTRIRDAAGAYTGYLLNIVHQAHLKERARIARELHDRVGPGLSVAHRQLELLEIMVADGSPRAAAKIDNAKQGVDEAMQNLRAVTSELRFEDPVTSMEKALLSFTETLRTDEVTIRVSVNGDETWAPPAVRDESFLVIREAIRNAFAHGAPAVVVARIDISPHDLRAIVEDDGVGFDADRVGERAGVGLSSMRERTELMGGALSVSSCPGRGVRVELHVPLPGHRQVTA